VALGSTQTNVARNSITTSPDETFGSTDTNIESGLDPNFAVERILAAAYAKQDELWIAPKKEMLLMYLNQYIPETSKKILIKAVAKTFAVEKKDNVEGEGRDNEL